MGSAPEPGSADGRTGAAPEDDDWLTGAVRPSVFRSVFQVLSAGGDVAGAGFLVDEGTGFSCAHVVRAAGGSPGGRVEVVFPRLPNAPRMTAEVAADGWRAPEDDDVAVLRFATVPAEAQGMAVGVSAGSRGHRLSSFGFPAQAPRGGHFGYGEAGGLLPAGNGAARLLQLAGANDLTTGFSGAPVVDEATGLVIGMVTSIASPDAHLKGLGIAYATPAEVLRAVLPRLAERPACPYLGLEPFDTRHARWFHGRATARERVLTALDGNRRLVMLLGPSGAGKSSLVNAGVLPALADGRIAGSDRWLPVCARPGHNLLQQLEDAGLPGAATDGPAAAVRALLAADTGHDRVLLVIDQFEELLTQPATDSSGRGAGDVRLDAVEQLVRLIDSHAPVTVLLIMRNDFYASLDALAPTLLNAATPGLCNIPATLSRPELLEIITGPAADVGLPLESGLAERIVNDIAGVDPTVRQAPVTLLPALELALLQLWRRRRRADGSLTHAAYEKIGEVTGSLSVWCDSALGQLPVEQRYMARRILTALVRPADEDNGIPATRRIVPLPRLRALTTAPDLEGPAADATFDTVLAALTRHRIVTTGTTATPGTPSGEPAAELIHDALIRDWADLRDWIAQDHRFQVWLLRATEQQARHAHSGLPDDLLQGSLLAEGEEWTGRHPLPAEITAFLTASRQREQAALRRIRRFNTVLAVLLALALLATGIALDQRRNATTARQAAVTAQHAAQSRELAAQSANVRDPDLASLLAVKAWRTSHTEEAAASLYAAPDASLRRSLKASTESVMAVAFSSDGATLATADEGGVVRLWDARTGSPRATLAHHTGDVTSVEFSPDSTTLATGDGGGVVRLWNARTGRLRTTLAGHGAKVDSIAFSPDGATLAAGLTMSAVVGELWDLRTRKLRHTVVVNSFLLPHAASVGFSPAGLPLLLLDLSPLNNDSKAWDMATGERRRVVRVDDWTRLPEKPAFELSDNLLAADDGRTVRLWDATKGRLRDSLDDYQLARLSPDRRTVVVLTDLAGPDTVDLWDTRTGARRTVLTGLAHQVASMAFSTDGSVLATGDEEGEVRLWDVAASRPRAVLTDPHQLMASVAFSPDSTTLATGNSGSENGTTAGTRLWDVRTGRIRRTLANRGDGVWSVAFSPDGTTLATGSNIGDTSDARLFDVRNGKLIRTISLGFTSDGVSVAFSPDGATLATGIRVSSRGSVRLWDARTGALRRTLSTDMGPNDVSLAFSPDGTTLATSSDDDKVRLWDPATGRLRTTLTDPIGLRSPVVFSADGALLATGSARDSVLLWDVKTGRPRTTLAGTESVSSLAFSPDGTLLATGSDNTVRLWDVKSGNLRTTFTGNILLVRGVAFSPDGTTLAAGNNDGTTLLWDTDFPREGAIADSICRGLQRDFTKAEKREYLHGQDSAPVCPDPGSEPAGEEGGDARDGG